MAESPVPLQFTPLVGVLAGVVVTLLLLILVVALVVRLKHKYEKRYPRDNSSSDNTEDSDYKSFKCENNENISSQGGSAGKLARITYLNYEKTVLTIVSDNIVVLSFLISFLEHCSYISHLPATKSFIYSSVI